jgi:hypothetical protein
MKTKMFRILVLLALTFSALMPATTARASAIGCSWNGSVDANWSTPGNWGSGCSGAGGIPGTGDTLTFPLGASNAAMTDDLPAISLQGLTFSGALNYTLNGANTISLTSGMDVQAENQTINAPLAVANGGVIFHAASGSNLALGGTLSLGTNNLALIVDSAAGVTGMQISNTVTGVSNSGAKLTKTGTGNLQIIGDLHQSIFDVDVNSGTLSLGPNPPGVWSGLPWSGKTTLALGTSLNLSNHAVIGSIAGAGNINQGSYLFQIRENQTTTFTGDISGSSQLAIIGNGAAILTIDRAGGTLSHTGEMNVNTSGMLKLLNTTATAANPGFAVTSGILELTNSHVGAIQLGYSGGGANYDGTLILSGSTANIASQITLVNNSKITSVINSATDYGRIDVTSPVDLGSGTPTFLLQGSYVPNFGETYNIIHNTNAGMATKTNAVFPGLPQGGTIPFNSVGMAADYQAAGNTTFSLLAITDVIPPVVASIHRASLNPTTASSVNFTVTFSEPVTGVSTAPPYSDFAVAATGITGAAVSGVSGDGAVYTVTVSTGTGLGTIRLDVLDNDTILDLAANPLGGAGAGNGDFNTGQSYNVRKALFGDVPVSFWAWQFIERLYNAGVTTGCSASPLNYCPANTVTRAEMAIFILRGIHGPSYSPPAVGLSTGFTDVPITYWAAAWIKQLAVEGITNGCGVGIYCPTSGVTRDQMAIFLLRGKHTSAYNPPDVGLTTGFNDVPITYWDAAWIKQLAMEGITNGCGPSLYCPKNLVTRAEMAVFLVRAFSLP